MSQEAKILEHMKAGNRLTPIDALQKFGCFRLGARVHDLRMQGYAINSTLVEQDGKRFARYWMEDGALESYKV